MLFLIMLENKLNLFLMEFMFTCPNTNLCALFVRIFFKTSKELLSQLPSVVSNILKISLFVDSVGF